jgi:hypothetical protein
VAERRLSKEEVAVTTVVVPHWTNDCIRGGKRRQEVAIVVLHRTNSCMSGGR